MEVSLAVLCKQGAGKENLLTGTQRSRFEASTMFTVFPETWLVCLCSTMDLGGISPRAIHTRAVSHKHGPILENPDRHSHRINHAEQTLHGSKDSHTLNRFLCIPATQYRSMAQYLRDIISYSHLK